MLICTVRAGIPSVQYFTLLLSQTQYDLARYGKPNSCERHSVFYFTILLPQTQYDLASQTVVGASRPLHNNNQQNDHHHHNYQGHRQYYYHHNIIIIVARATWRWLIHNNSSQNHFHFHLRNVRMLGLVFNVWSIARVSASIFATKAIISPSLSFLWAAGIYCGKTNIN